MNPCAFIAMRGIWLAIAEGVSGNVLATPLRRRQNHAPFCAQKIDTPPFGSAAMCGVGAPEPMPLPDEIFTGAEKLVPLFARLLNQMSLALAQVTYTPAAFAAICGCEEPLFATVIVEEN